MPILTPLTPIAEEVDRLTDAERERLFSLAIVRGYRIQANNRSGTHAILRLHREGRREVYPQRYPSKKEARRALLRLMLTETRRRAA